MSSATCPCCGRISRLASIVLLLFVVMAQSATVWGQRAMKPSDIAMLEAVSGARIAPDGEHVAYLRVVPRKPIEDEDGGSWSRLHVLGPEGDDREFIGGKVNIGAPHWSADSKALYYTARRNGDSQSAIYRIPIDGGESKKVLDHATSIGAFAVHPDDEQVAFIANLEEDEDVAKNKGFGFDQEIFEEDWQYSRVWIANLQGEEAGEPRMLSVAGSASQLHWSPEGDRLVVVVAPTPSVDDSYMAKQVHVVDPEDGRILATVAHRSKLGAVAWSPDGQFLAMIAGADINDPKDGRLMVAEVGDNPEREIQPVDLMPEYEAHVTSFVWRDNRQLVWSAGEGTLSRIGTVDVGEPGNVTTVVAPNAETGIFSALSIDEDGARLAMQGHSREHYVELFAIDLDTTAALPVRLTNSNPWLEDIGPVQQETVWWTAKDGLQLQGVLIYPDNYQQGRRYPMIMVVHGGPESHESDGWMTTYSRPGRMAAARGFFVFYPNYRGSTGRGVEFSKRGQADAAGKEFEDLIDAIDHLVDAGFVDRSKVGITGGSYGGYASAWGATYYSQHFAASVMFVGISDNVSKVGTTDIPEEMYLVHHRKRLWDDWEYFANSSPIKYVQKNRTPTLILHGKEDPRVHPSQSLELHRHLKVLGQAPVRLVMYEGEGHGNRKAAARFDYSLRQIRWMEHFLQSTATSAPDWQLDYESELGMAPEEDAAENESGE